LEGRTQEIPWFGWAAGQDKALQSCNVPPCRFLPKSGRVWVTLHWTRADSTGEEKGGGLSPADIQLQALCTCLCTSGSREASAGLRGARRVPLRGDTAEHRVAARPRRAPLLPGCWFGEHSLGPTPGAWPGLRYPTTAWIKSWGKMGSTEHTAEQWMLLPSSQLEHLSLGAVHYIPCPAQVLGTEVMEQVFPRPWAALQTPFHGEGLFTRVCSERTRGNGCKLKEGRFRWDIRKKFFTMMRVVEHWPRLPREAVAAPSLAGFKARLDGALSNLIWWKMSLLMAGGLEPDEL